MKILKRSLQRLPTPSIPRELPKDEPESLPHRSIYLLLALTFRDTVKTGSIPVPDYKTWQKRWGLPPLTVGACCTCSCRKVSASTIVTLPKQHVGKSPLITLWGGVIQSIFFCLCQRSTSTLCLRRQVGHQKVPPVLLLPSFCSCNQSWWAQLQGNVGKNCISFLLKYGFPCFLVIVRQIQNLATEELSHIVRLLQNSPQLSLLGCSRT